MKTEYTKLFGEHFQFEVWFSVIILALLVLAAYAVLKCQENKNKRDKEAETAYKHRELGNADLYQRKH